MDWLLNYQFYVDIVSTSRQEIGEKGLASSIWQDWVGPWFGLACNLNDKMPHRWCDMLYLFQKKCSVVAETDSICNLSCHSDSQLDNEKQMRRPEGISIMPSDKFIPWGNFILWLNFRALEMVNVIGSYYQMRWKYFKICTKVNI